MGIFVPEDNYYNELERQVGFNRYKQLIGRHWSDWIKLNTIVLIGMIPLAAGILFSLAVSSILVLIPCSFIGGCIFGPFLAGMYDSILRGMRDDPRPWFTNFKKSWKQNFKESLLPGGLLGMTIGLFSFIGMLLWVSRIPPTPATILILLFSVLIFNTIFQLYFIQMVLFQQSAFYRLRNIALFSIKYFKSVFGIGVLQIIYWAIYLLFAPWTILLILFIGIWYILFLSILIIYRHLDEAYRIEELFLQADLENEPEIVVSEDDSEAESVIESNTKSSTKKEDHL